MPEDRHSLLDNPPIVINLGLEGFAEALDEAGADVVHVDWRPPADGDPELAWELALMGA